MVSSYSTTYRNTSEKSIICLNGCGKERPSNIYENDKEINYQFNLRHKVNFHKVNAWRNRQEDFLYQLVSPVVLVSLPLFATTLAYGTMHFLATRGDSKEHPNMCLEHSN